jgi:PEP-CTERM motif
VITKKITTAFVLAAASALLSAPSAHAQANIFIDWSTVTLPAPTTTAAIWSGTVGAPNFVTGFTAGDVINLSGVTSGAAALPFTCTWTFSGTTMADTGLTNDPGSFFQLSRGTQGGVANSLFVTMGNGSAGTSTGQSDGVFTYINNRTSNQKVTMNFAIDTSGFPGTIDSSEFMLLDVDNGDATATPSWRDKVQFLTPGGVFTPVNPGNYTISGGMMETNLGVGNTAFSSNASNIQAFYAPATLSLDFEYTPGTSDALTGGNQLIGFNGAGFFSANLTSAPEPGTLVLLALGGLAMRRRRKA